MLDAFEVLSEKDSDILSLVNQVELLKALVKNLEKENDVLEDKVDALESEKADLEDEVEELKDYINYHTKQVSPYEEIGMSPSDF